MDNEREHEISEETLSLVRELGERLDEDAGASLMSRPFAALMARPVELDLRLEERVESLRQELEFLDRQMSALSGRFARLRADLRRAGSDDADELDALGRQMADLISRHVLIRAELRHLRRNREAAMYRGARARPAGRYRGSLPDYLEDAEMDIMMGRPGAYWLHGEDARERARAVDALAERMSGGGKVFWATAVVNLSGAAGRRRPRPTNELESAVRRAWDSWEDTGGWPDLSELARAAGGEAAYGGRAGVGIILAEFPAKQKKARGFLEWLAATPVMGSTLVLLFVSAASPPPADGHSAFRPVLCETAAVRLGRRVTELRLRRGWNRAELAERARVPQVYVREIEAGLREPWDEHVLLRVAAELDLDIDELITDVSRPEET